MTEVFIIEIPAEETETEPTTYRDMIGKLLEEVGQNLDAPYYASKMLIQNGNEILDIVEHLEKEIELLKRR